MLGLHVFYESTLYHYKDSLKAGLVGKQTGSRLLGPKAMHGNGIYRPKINGSLRIQTLPENRRIDDLNRIPSEKDRIYRYNHPFLLGHIWDRILTLYSNLGTSTIVHGWVPNTLQRFSLVLETVVCEVACNGRSLG